MSALKMLSDNDLVALPEGSLRLNAPGEHVVYFWSEDRNLESVIRAFSYDAKKYTLLAHPSHDTRNPWSLEGRYVYRARLPQIAAFAPGEEINTSECYTVCDANKVVSDFVRHTTHDAITIEILGKYVNTSGGRTYGRRSTDGFGRNPYGRTGKPGY